MKKSLYDMLDIIMTFFNKVFFFGSCLLPSTSLVPLWVSIPSKILSYFKACVSFYLILIFVDEHLKFFIQNLLW